MAAKTTEVDVAGDIDLHRHILPVLLPSFSVRLLVPTIWLSTQVRIHERISTDQAFTFTASHFQKPASKHYPRNLVYSTWEPCGVGG